MAGLSDYMENKWVDALLRNQAFSSPVNVYVALITCTNGVRQNATTYAVNNTIAVLANDGRYHLYKCTAITTGTTAGSQGTLYPGLANEVIVDSGATFTEQDSVLDTGAGTFVEVSGGAYARVAVATSLANFSGTQGAGTTVASTGTGGQSSNNVAVTFPTSTAAWAAAPAMVWGWALFDASGAGNLLVWGALTSPQNIGIGATPSFSNGQLSVTLS